MGEGFVIWSWGCVYVSPVVKYYMSPERERRSEIDRLGESNFIEVVGDQDFFIHRINSRALELLKHFQEEELIPRLPELKEAGRFPRRWDIFTGEVEEFSVEEIIAVIRYHRHLVSQGERGVWFAKEDLQKIWDYYRNYPYNFAVDHILERLYQHAGGGELEMGSESPAHVFLGGVVDMLVFPNPDVWGEEVVLRHMAERLAHFVSQGESGEFFPFSRATVLGMMFSDLLEQKVGYLGLNFMTPIAPLRKLYPRLKEALDVRALRGFEYGYSTPAEELLKRRRNLMARRN